METGKGKLDSTKIVSFATQGILKIKAPVEGVVVAVVVDLVVVFVVFVAVVGVNVSCIGSFSQIKFALKQKEMKNVQVQKLRSFTFHCSFDRSNESEESHPD